MIKGENMKILIEKIKEHLMFGISNMIPYVIMGGVFTAISIIIETFSIESNAFFLSSFIKNILQLGEISFSLLIPILSGYIAYSIGGASALAPAMINGFFISDLKLGIFGGIIVGFFSGYVSKYINKINLQAQFKVLMPIFIIPLFTVLIVSNIMHYSFALTVFNFLQRLEVILEMLSINNSKLLIIILASMIAFDMGGPVNKIAYFFSVAMLAIGRSEIMGAVGVAICIPPISLGIINNLSLYKHSEGEKEVGKASIIMGFMGITEGAIPFALMSPLKIIMSNIIGATLGASVALATGVKSLAPHGGLIVLPIVENKLMYIFSIVVGVISQILFILVFERVSKHIVSKF